MRDLDDAALERRLSAVLKEHLGALPLDLTADALDRRREAKGVARRFGRGRGLTLFAAAALLLVGGALAAGSGLLRLPSVVPPLPAPSVVAVATTSPDATSPDPSESAAPSASPIPVAGPGGVWIPTGSMVTPRAYHWAVRLVDDRVLVVGGYSDAGDSLTSAELYDPATGTWSATGTMLRPTGIPAVLLPDGTVLARDAVYNPASGTWTSTGPMDGILSGATVTVLRDGKVLVAVYRSALLYDPASGTWTATGKMNVPRRHAAATLLSDGKVLVAGGSGLPLDNPNREVSAEVYDPVTGSWTAIANMHAPHYSLTATLLGDGKVLVAGSNDNDARPQGEAEVYDPATGTWTALPARPGIRFDSATLLSDGTVLVAGHVGGNAERPDCTAAELYDPRTGSWTTASSMLRCGNGSSFTLLLDGTVLVAGGSTCNGDDVCVANGAAELYVPAGVSPPPLPAFPSPPPPVFPSPTPEPSPTPRPTPLPPAVGPVPPSARSWTVTVDNKSSEPATLFVAEEDENGTLRLVGSATPNVVPARATVKVTFLFPAKGGPDGWIYVNPRPGEGGSLVHAADIGIPGKILISAEGDGGWLSP